MKKIGDITSTADDNGEFTNGVVATGVNPTILEADWFNTIQRELVKVVEGGGLTLDPNDNTQVWKAIESIVNGKIDIATTEDIKAGTAGKLVDAAGLKNNKVTAEDLAGDGLEAVAGKLNVVEDTGRFTIIYPNGGTEAAPAEIAVVGVYLMDNPFPGALVLPILEILFNGEWTQIGQALQYASSTAYSCGAFVGQHNDDGIVLTVSTNFLMGNYLGTGNTAAHKLNNVTKAPARIKVWKMT